MAAARLSLSSDARARRRYLKRLEGQLYLTVAIACLFFGWLAAAAPVSAEVMLAAEETEQRYLARIQVHTAAELEDILKRADELFMAQQPEEAFEPIVFVLHGAEGRVFLRQSYGASKDLVDLAARLSALKIVDIRVCERWMGGQRIDARDLQPFVTTVPFGPAEIKRLLGDENYVYF